MEGWGLSNPPVWETAVAAVTSSPSVFDSYEIAAVHDRFRSDFPRAERQAPILGLEAFRVQAPIGLGLQPLELLSAPNLTRWWFTTEDSRNLIQLQENLIGRNWRRIGDAPAISQSYTNFDGLWQGFEQAVEQITAFSYEQGRDPPTPQLLSVTYINHLNQARINGSTRTMRETVSFLNFPDQYLKSGVNIGWVEKVPGEGSEALYMQVMLHFLATPTVQEDGSIVATPFARLAFDARGPCATWSEARLLAARSHSYMRERLMALTTDELQATWA